MPALIANPQIRVAEKIGEDSMLDTDPYSLGFCVLDYRNNGSHEVAVYDLGDGLLAYFSFNARFGHGLVVHRNGVEVFAGRVAGEADARALAAGFLS